MLTCTSGLLWVICFTIARQGLTQYSRKTETAELPREQTGYVYPTTGYEQDHVPAHNTKASENYDFQQNSYGQNQPQIEQYEGGSAPVYQNSYASQEYNGQYSQATKPQYTEGYDANSYGNHIPRPIQSKGHNPYPGEEYQPSQNAFHHAIQNGDYNGYETNSRTGSLDDIRSGSENSIHDNHLYKGQENYFSIDCKGCGNGYKHGSQKEISSRQYHEVPTYKNVIETKTAPIVTFKQIPRVVLRQVHTQVPVVRMVPRVVNFRTTNINHIRAFGH